MNNGMMIDDVVDARNSTIWQRRCRRSRAERYWKIAGSIFVTSLFQIALKRNTRRLYRSYCLYLKLFRSAQADYASMSVVTT